MYCSHFKRDTFIWSKAKCSPKPLSWIVREQQRWRRETDANAGSRQSRTDKDSAESSQKSNNGGRGKDGDDPVQLKKVMGPQEEKEHVQLAEVMGLQQQNLGAETSLVRSSRGAEIDPKEAVSFIRHQQKEAWEALKKQMGPFHLAPSYEYTPGSRLPPRKVYVLHGTKGYELEDVVCGEDATAGQRGRVASGSCNLGCQKTGGIEGSEGDGKERKGKSAREEVDTEREYEIRRESEKQENLFIEGVKPVVGL